VQCSAVMCWLFPHPCQRAVQDGPRSLQLHIAPKGPQQQQGQKPGRSITGSIGLAGAGVMGQQVVPGTVKSMAMVSSCCCCALDAAAVVGACVCACHAAANTFTCGM
jgi:hypothetical protein